MQSWQVREGRESDLPDLVRFNCQLARETEGRELNAETVQRGVARGLQLAPEAQYYVADDAEGPIGTLMLTREWSDWRNGWLAWVQSVYVIETRRGEGVFRSLLHHALDQLGADRDVVGIRLYVETANERAQAVYRRSGFGDPNYKVLERLLRVE